MSLSYEKCKELKEAGFPQGVGDYKCPPDHDHDPDNNKFLNGLIYKDRKLYCPQGSDIVFNPTLEELIEWCGDINLKIERWPLGKKWEVACCDNTKHKAEGLSSKEAVANLGIAIHKNEK